MHEESLREWLARMRIVDSLESILDWAALEEIEQTILRRVVAKVKQATFKENAERVGD